MTNAIPFGPSPFAFLLDRMEVAHDDLHKLAREPTRTIEQMLSREGIKPARQLVVTAASLPS